MDLKNMIHKRIVPICAALTLCLVLHVSTKCDSEFSCGPECGRPCPNQQPAICPFGFYKFGDFCYPLSTDVCPPNKTLTSNGCRPVAELCPTEFVYVNGVCVNKTLNDAELLCTNSGNCSQPSICGPDMVLFNGTCVSTAIASCPVNFTLEDGICVRDIHCNSTSCDAVHCPVGMILMNGTCITLTCPDNTFKINGICARCPTNSHYFNGQCTQCPIFMVFRNGLCVCPIEGHVVHNNSCVDINILLQRTPEVISVPVERVVYNVTVPYYKSNNVKTNITNRVNHTYTPNVITKANGTNINLLDLSTFSNSSNHVVNVKHGNKYKPAQNSSSHTHCCIIIHPRNCRQINNETQWRCTKRRYHACGIECTRQRNQTLPDDKIIEIPVPYSIYKPYAIPAALPPPRRTRPTPVEAIPLPAIIAPPTEVQPPLQTVPQIQTYQQVQQPVVLSPPLSVQEIPITYQQEPQMFYPQPQIVYQDPVPILYQQPEMVYQTDPMLAAQPQLYSSGCNGVQCGQEQSMAVPAPVNYMPESSCTWPYCS